MPELIPSLQWKYSYRLVNPESVDDIIEVADGQELPFGSGPGNQPQSPSPTQHDIELPDPTFCNLHLAISRIAHESGASKIADELCEAWESDRRAERRVVAPGMNNRVGGNGRNGLDADALWYKLKELQVHPEEGCSGEEDDDDHEECIVFEGEDVDVDVDVDVDIGSDDDE